MDAQILQYCRGYEMPSNMELVCKDFLLQSLALLHLAIGATMETHMNLSKFSLNSRVFLGSLSYQWTELSLYKGQEQPDL